MPRASESSFAPPLPRRGRGRLLHGARQKGGAANSTINRELGALRRGFRLALQAGFLPSVPVIRTLKEHVRTGFFEPTQFLAVRHRLPPDLQAAITIAYTFGWRMQSEVLTLTLRQLDLEAGTLRLEPGTTKNDEGRLVYLPADLKAELAAQVERVHEAERRSRRIIPYLFPHLTGRYQGQRIRDFRRAWKTACRKAGLPRRLRHDFRRTAVRNLVNAGIPERVAMQVSGHKTRSVFDRYYIVSPRELQAVARTLTGTMPGTPGRSWEEGGDGAVRDLQEVARTLTGTISGTMRPRAGGEQEVTR